METAFFFKDMYLDEEENVRDYFYKKLLSITKLLKHFPEDAVILEVKAKKFEKHSAYEVELVLKLPSETLASKEASHHIHKAVDLAKDRLTVQIKRFMETMRRGHRSIKLRNLLKHQVELQAEYI